MCIRDSPYLIYQYRKFGSVPWLRTFIVYSFVFYLLCAYFLVLLPLPENRSAVVPYAQTPQLVPFNFVREFLAETTFSVSDPTTWLPVLRDPYVYEALFNVLLLVPLDVYKRQHSHRVTNRVFRPNVQKITIKDKEGHVRKANVCTKCMKAGKVERA